MNKNRLVKAFIKVLMITSLATGASTSLQSQSLDIDVHDPVMTKQGDTYYIFYTGSGVGMMSSNDMKEWQRIGSVFSQTPAWVADTLPPRGGRGRGGRGGRGGGNDNMSLWAPDIGYRDGTYFLYYSASSFGSNNSAIGVATNTTLDSTDPEYEWIDHGPVVHSVRNRDMFNAIDPNLAFDDDGNGWLSFGSFWSGMKLFKLNDTLTRPAQPEEWYTIAARDRYWKLETQDAGDVFSSAIEAPFIFKKNGMYYLFVSWDRCCAGVNSTYKILVGRSDTITGPYLDKAGEEMRLGGGSLVVGGNEDWPGVGHNSAYTFDGTDYLVFHGYDASQNGRSKLWIKEIEWDANGWPSVTLD